MKANLVVKENTPLYDSLKSFLVFLKSKNLTLNQIEVMKCSSLEVLQDFSYLSFIGMKDFQIIELVINLAQYSPSIKEINLYGVRLDFNNLEFFKTLAAIPNLESLDISSTGLYRENYQQIAKELLKSKSLLTVASKYNFLSGEAKTNITSLGVERDLHNKAELYEILKDPSVLDAPEVISKLIGEYAVPEHLSFEF